MRGLFTLMTTPLEETSHILAMQATMDFEAKVWSAISKKLGRTDWTNDELKDHHMVAIKSNTADDSTTLVFDGTPILRYWPPLVNLYQEGHAQMVRVTQRVEELI